MRSSVRRLLPLALGGLVLLSLAPVASATTAMTTTEAERYEVELLNRQRAALGVVPVRIDSRLTAIARARSLDMAKKDYFGHKQPDGKWAWDLMTEAGITWYAAGEILAWNSWDDLRPSAETASDQWHDSPSHYAVLKDPNFNYVGVGVAIDGGKKIWTAIFMKGPDRTGAWSRMNAPVLGSTKTALSPTGATVTTRNVRISWYGADVKLSVLTAGFQDFQVQKRLNGGSWRLSISATTRTYVDTTLTRGILYEIRVRGRDRKGNYGSWSPAIQIRP